MPDSAKHLLLVDDEAALREVVAERLSDRGFDVQQAASGEQAVSKLAEFAFDILITDLRLPGIGGREVVQTALDRFGCRCGRPHRWTSRRRRRRDRRRVLP